MSYTMTLDMPAKTAAWFEKTRQSMTAAELGALFVVFLRQQMDEKNYKPKLTLLEACRACPVDVDFNELIPPRSKRAGRAHHIDLSADES